MYTECTDFDMRTCNRKIYSSGLFSHGKGYQQNQTKGRKRQQEFHANIHSKHLLKISNISLMSIIRLS